MSIPKRWCCLTHLDYFFDVKSAFSLERTHCVCLSHPHRYPALLPAVLFPTLTRLPESATADPFALSLQAGLMVTSAVSAAVQLRLFDALEDEPLSLAMLAHKTGTHEPSLLLLLRALSCLALCTEAPTRTFAHTPRSRALRTDAEGGMAALVALWGANYQWEAWAHLAHTIQTGRPALEAVYGKGTTIWSYLAQHPQERDTFHQGLTANSRLVIPAILDRYDFSRIHQLIDVGGGQGSLCRALVEHYPNLHAVLFDQAEVIAQVRAQMQTFPSAVAARYHTVAGDFFTALPPDGECYLLKNVLMDWSDDEACQILHGCREAMEPHHGRVLVIEPVIGSNTPFTRFFSLQMAMMMRAARHRSLEEHQLLATAAGLSLRQAIPLGMEQMLLAFGPSDQEQEDRA